ncbi:uncharacterized protein EV422DRAFT_358257 [Fimicolochytrium jonesii]|uniref:uncharacterized protein n=1 Tax=Fimicolochytrium jonesii TaxID=1396493 RepID=UPI0022FE2F23|nr:uncharacterized protein EV422DRAFT_358257 [Fimicolochytrium jonesii]KAI8823507.1 hypothetical protein EV422DRAFT_358257 [Fimicolochytrium jonesii]
MVTALTSISITLHRWISAGVDPPVQWISGRWSGIIREDFTYKDHSIAINTTGYADGNKGPRSSSTLGASDGKMASWPFLLLVADAERSTTCRCRNWGNSTRFEIEEDATVLLEMSGDFFSQRPRFPPWLSGGRAVGGAIAEDYEQQELNRKRCLRVRWIEHVSLHDVEDSSLGISA